MSGEYLFRFLRAVADREGYYVTRWDRAVPVTVTAATESEARKAAAALSGTPPRGRYWTFSIQSVEPAKGDEKGDES